MTPLVRIALLVGAAALFVARALSRKDREAPSQASTHPRAFISFDFDNDLKVKNLFAGQCSKHSPTPFTAQDWSSKEELPQREWERLIHEKIGRCHMMFVLVSPTSHKAAGVAKEIQMAIEQSVPFVGVYISHADKTTELPKGLVRERTIPWEWKEIAAQVDRMKRGAANRF